MPKIAIVTDSTADLDPGLAREKGISVIPLNLHFEDEVYKDGIDLDQKTFFTKLEAAQVPPRTSQPSPGEFHELYLSLLASGFTGIISIHISRELSGTWQSATIARSMLPQEDIWVVDSKSASMGLGLIVLNTWDKVAAGADGKKGAAYAAWLSGQQKIMFGVDTLEYLHRNGRIGRAAKLIGGFLNIKPVLTVDADGFVAPQGKVRGGSKFIPYLLEGAQEFVRGYAGNVDLAVIHTLDHQLGTELLNRIAARIPVRTTYMRDIGSVIGTHTGPGTIGFILQKLDLP